MPRVHGETGRSCTQQGTQCGVARVADISVPLLLIVKLAENVSGRDGQLLAPSCALLLNNSHAALPVRVPPTEYIPLRPDWHSLS